MNRLNSPSKETITILGALLFYCLLVLLFLTFPLFIGEKVFDRRPDLSPAPKPFTDGYVQHYERRICSSDEIFDIYTVEKTVVEVKEYYFKEMTKLCLSSEGRSVTISSMKCHGGKLAPLERDCYHSSCILKEELPNLSESFSVEIYPVSPSQVEVETIHDITYSLKNETKVPCGE